MIGDIYRHLMSLVCVPTGGTVQLYFTHASQHVNWDDMIESLGLGPLPHFHMWARTLGGATGDSEPGSSRRRKDTACMDEILDAEGLDEWGEPDKSKPCQPPQDNDFNGDDGSSSDDSDVEMVMSNKEVAALLPSHLLKGKEHATEPNSSQPIASTSMSSAPAPDNTPPTGRTSRKKQGLNLTGAHSGENMANVVWDTVTKFGLRNHIIVFIMDNTTNNDTLVEAFERKCHELNIPFESKHAHNSLNVFKLLKAIRASMKEEHKKAVANSRKLACQDSTTESLLAEADDHTSQSGDSPDDTAAAAANLNAAGATPAKPMSLIDLAVFKLRKIV
ncbi:hypothetical protein C8R43DRAFT_1124886 [Mycena crocata]|nr:hypothetical protein C8R43DRAFT_1124886 [Mycena crocata]